MASETIGGISVLYQTDPNQFKCKTLALRNQKILELEPDCGWYIKEVFFPDYYPSDAIPWIEILIEKEQKTIQKGSNSPMGGDAK